MFAEKFKCFSEKNAYFLEYPRDYLFYFIDLSIIYLYNIIDL